MSVSTRKSDDGRKHAYLNQIFPFGFGDERLELGCSESVDQAGLGHDEEEDLCARKDR